MFSIYLILIKKHAANAESSLGCDIKSFLIMCPTLLACVVDHMHISSEYESPELRKLKRTIQALRNKYKHKIIVQHHKKHIETEI